MYEDPQPRLFSFNNPFGACPTCHGFGNIIELDMNLVVPDTTKSRPINGSEAKEALPSSTTIPAMNTSTLPPS
jgi:excinuclease UvrABC ATPase subunit